jgi:hypothetical protein
LVSVFVFQIDEVEANFLSEISIFSRRQDPFQTLRTSFVKKTGDDSIKITAGRYSQRPGRKVAEKRAAMALPQRLMVLVT